MPAAFSIRPATIDDAPAMGECMVTSWLDAHDGQMPDELVELRRREWTPEASAGSWWRTIDEIDATDGHPTSVRVATSADERLLGIGMITVGNETAEVNALYVAPDAQGTGVGRALLSALAAVAVDDGAGWVELFVLTANAAARGFYEHLGGEVRGVGEFDEEGTPLPTVVYRWPATLLAGVGAP